MNLEEIRSENLNKELAYLFGVYLTDGSISHFSDKWGTYNNFSLKAIDEDFVEFTLFCIKKVKPSCSANVYIQKPRTRYWPDGRKSKCQQQYCLNVGWTDYKDFFENQTGKKHHIPMLIWDASLSIKKWFIAGAMDGDGWISKKRRKNKKDKYQFQIGIAGIREGWIYEFRELLQKIGVKTSSMRRIDYIHNQKRKTPLASFDIKISSFANHGLFFTIKRKQNRLKTFIKERSTT